LEVIMPTILAKAKAEMTVAEIPAPQRASIPLPTSRSSAAPVSEPPFARERPIEPHLNLFTKPTLREVPRVSQLEPVAGKPMMPASQASPLQFSLVEPSAPPTSSHLDAELLAVPVEVKTALSPLDSLSSQKIATLLGGRRRREDFIVENQPIPAEGAQVPVSMGSTLQVQSQPNGAQVYVNGKSIGKTPLTWELPLGKHEVRLALPDYYGWESQIELTESNQAHPIFIRLLSAK
jgi:hypothetical protein